MDGYYAWMIVATAFVLMMTTPALALFYGGMTRSKSVLNMMMMSYISMAIVGIIFVLWGWSEGFGTLGDGKLFNNPFTYFGLKDIPSASWIGGPMFQMTFAVITAALISGAIADRVKLSSWCIFLPFWITLAYLPIAHMVFWGGFISTHLKAQDYAGGTVVHINAGIAGAVLAIVIGRRVGWPRDPMRPHNLTLTMVGAGLLWVGWYGFNVGSYVWEGNFKAGPWEAQAGVTFVNTTIATMAAAIGWLVVERFIHGKATTLGVASGIVAGLVAITPACGAVTILGAILIGLIAGAVCAVAVGLKYKLKADDSLDVIGVHLVGGIIGTVLIGLFSSVGGARSATEDGLFYGGGLASLGHQAGAAAFSLVWTGVITTILALIIKYTIGWRITEEAEVEGIDFDQHGESAYDLGTSISGGSTGVLAAATATHVPAKGVQS